MADEELFMLREKEVTRTQGRNEPGRMNLSIKKEKVGNAAGSRGQQ